MCAHKAHFFFCYLSLSQKLVCEQLRFPGMLRLQVTSTLLISLLLQNYRLSFNFVMIIVHSLLVYSLVYITKTSTAKYSPPVHSTFGQDNFGEITNLKLPLWQAQIHSKLADVGY